MSLQNGQTIAVYKPKGMTSHDVIAQVRRITGIKKVGHAGTLDPLATGVLVVAIGREATKQLNTIVKKEKEYIATIKLGFTSTTDDEEGEKTIRQAQGEKFEPPSKEKIEVALKEFIGKIKQTPPQFSAIKLQGKPAYKAARKGEKVELKPREVLIKEIELQDYKFPLLKIRVVTGPGVYIRSLARDLGEKLRTGAYLADLERTKVGEFILKDCITLENLKN